MDDDVLFADGRETVAAMLANAFGKARIVGLELEIGPVDSEKLGKTAQDVVEELREGSPRIWVRQDNDEDSFVVRMLTLKEGGETIIGERLRELL